MLYIRSHRADQELALAVTAGGRVSALRPDWSGGELRLESLVATPHQLRFRARGRVRASWYTLAADQLLSLRLQVVGRSAELLTLRLNLATRDGQSFMLRFRHRELDREEEACDLAMRLARCLGFRIYGIEHRGPLDLVARPGPESESPYRAGHLLPIPRRDEPIDYSERPPSLEESWGESSADASGFLLREGWQITTWKPGVGVALRRPGKSHAAALPSTILLKAPLLVLGGLLGAVFIWGILTLAFLLALVPVFLVFLVLGSDPPMLLAYLIGLVSAGAGLYGLFLGAGGAWLTLQRWHRSSMEHRQILDWQTETIRREEGGQPRWSEDFKAVRRVALRRVREGVWARELACMYLILECAGGERELCRFVAPSEEEEDEIEKMSRELARALKVAFSQSPSDSA